MAPHAVLGSSPTVRSSTPQPQRSGAKGANSVVPFTRRTGFAEKGDGSRQEGSRISGEGSSLPARQRYSLDDRYSRSPGGSGLSSRSLPALRRPELIPQTVQRGFNAPPASQRPPTSPQQPRRTSTGSAAPVDGAPAGSSATGLLTRQFSSDLVRRPDQSELQRKLEKCMEKPAAVPRPPSSEPQPGLSSNEAAAAQLARLKAHHAVFGGPVVGRAHALAAATLAPARLEANTATASILADLGLDADTVAAALLHDALHASPLTRQELEKFMPAAVTDMVANVSRISSACQLLQADTATQEPETAAKLTTMLLAMADVRAVLVALAARLARLRSAAALAAAGATDLRAEAEHGLRVFAPLANRLGVWSLKAELEDLCFLVLHPQRAKELRDSLAQPQSRAGLASALTQLKTRLDDCGLSYEDLSGRPKNLYGVHTKLQRKGVTEADVSQVYDVRALRLIVSSKQDCYAALREVERLWPTVPGRFKDYIRTPKANGYQSLHTVVAGPDGHPIEVQIRTAKMHYIAEYGVAAHWRYKEKLAGEASHTDQLVGWARWLITWQLELQDGKTRPRGSPPRDASLASLLGGHPAAFPPPAGSPLPGGTLAAAVASAGPAVVPAPAAGPATAAAPAPAAVSCTFPEHHPDCRFARYVASERFAPRVTPDHLASPTYIVLLDGTAATSAALAGGAAMPVPAGAGTAAAAPLPSVEEVPAGTTVAALLSGAGPKLAAHSGLRVLVNGEVASDPQQLLVHGDQVAIFDAEPVPLQRASSNVLPFTRKLSSAATAPQAGSSAAAAAGPAAGAAAGIPAVAGHPAAVSHPVAASPKPPGSPSRAIPSLGPRPAFAARSSAGGRSAFAAGGGGGMASIGFDDAPPAPLPAGSPAGETAAERAERMAAQRTMLDRAFSRSASERLETLVARPDWLPPEMHRRPQRPQQPQPA